MAGTQGATEELQEVVDFLHSPAGFLRLVQDEQGVPLSSSAAAAMDAQVQALLRRHYERACAILAENRAALEALALALIERETIDGAEALAIFEANGVDLPARAT